MSLAKTFIVVDSRHMSSFALSRSARGAVHIEPLDQLKATVTPRERGRPAALGNRGRAYGLMQLSAGTRDEDEDTRRFCREGAAWIKRAAAGIGKGETATRLTVFVPPRLLGILRAECGKLPASVVLKRIDLGGLSASALAKHRSVLAIAPGAKARAERVLA
jgi:protein required for attachment to host cells